MFAAREWEFCVSIELRSQLVRHRATAMTTGAAIALAEIESSLKKLAEAGPINDRAALLNLQAEILLLNDELHESRQVFESTLDELATQLPPLEQIVIRSNRTQLMIQLHDMSSYREHDRLVDEAGVLGLRFTDHRSVLSAYEAAADGKHYDALPKLWGELLRCFRMRSWSAYQAAAKRLSDEFVELGRLPDALYYAIDAGDCALAAKIGGRVLALNQGAYLNDMVKEGLSRANLAHHAQVILSFLGEVVDGLSDENVELTINFGTNWASREVNWIYEEETFVRAWKFLRAIAFRAAPAAAERIVQVAIRHTAWNTKNLMRRHLISAMSPLVPRLQLDIMLELAKVALPAATSLREDFDYSDALRLLARLAEAHVELQKLLGKELYPANEPIGNDLLARLVSSFGRGIVPDDSCRQAILGIADMIRNQVMRTHGEVNELPKVPGGYGSHISWKDPGGEKLVVQIASINSIRPALVHRTLVDDKTITTLFEACMQSLRDKDNSLDNKMILVESLRELCDVLREPEVVELRTELLVLAAGKITEPAHFMKKSELDDPLNPFKLSSGEPEGLRVVALRCLAACQKRFPGPLSDEIERVFLLALLDRSDQVRAIAYSVVANMTSMSPSFLAALFVGMNEADPNCAAQAIHAMAELENLTLSDGDWQIVVIALTKAALSKDANLRGVAANAIHALRQRQQDLDRLRNLDTLSEHLSRDSCFSVRQALQLPNAQVQQN